MPNLEHLAVLTQGVTAWHNWRKKNNFNFHPSMEPELSEGIDFRPDLKGADLSGQELSGANLYRADLSESYFEKAKLNKAKLNGANLADSVFRHSELKEAILLRANLTRADLFQTNLAAAQLQNANLNLARLVFANLNSARLMEADLTESNLSGTDAIRSDFTEANLTAATLIGANFTEANFARANLTNANLTGANLSGANLEGANLTSVKWNPSRMRGKFKGIRGLDSSYGNALFKRAAADQDFLDTLEQHWSGSWRKALFWAWSTIDYGRSLLRIVSIASALALFYGLIYLIWPSLLNYPVGKYDWFTPFYFSIVTYTTLGFGDVTPVGHWQGEFIVSSEVVLGYVTLGLLLAVLAE